ncbi:MAG: GNAT family N-acetyltransferase [Bilifractor sp.]|jgi:L-amino acid N-acyltransferase YncA
MNLTVRKATEEDLPDMIRIWNDVVEEGMAFPQEETLDTESGKDFFFSMYTAVAVLDQKIVGLYILHPNNVGRVGHIANASYAVDRDIRGKHIGEKLVRDSLCQAKAEGYRILQFNAVVVSNVHAYNLYIREGFTDLGVIPGGFHNKNGEYEDIHVMYAVL